MGGTNKIKPHTSSLRTEKKQEVGGVWTVKGVYNTLSLGDRCLSIEPTPGVTKVNTEILQQIESLGIIRH